MKKLWVIWFLEKTLISLLGLSSLSIVVAQPDERHAKHNPKKGALRLWSDRESLVDKNEQTTFGLISASCISSQSPYRFIQSWPENRHYKNGGDWWGQITRDRLNVVKQNS